MRQKEWKRIIGLFLILIIAFLYARNHIGMGEDSIEAFARRYQDIPEDWNAKTYTSTSTAAVLFYSENEEYAYSIFTTNPGISVGFFYKMGGSIAATDNRLVGFHPEGHSENIYMALNNHRIKAVEVEDGALKQTSYITDNEPFVHIELRNIDSIVFYNTRGNVVEPEMID